MPAINLKANLKRLRDKPYHFTLVKGGDDAQLYVSLKAPKTTVLDEIKRACGDGKRICRGVCFWDDDTLVFETSTIPSPAWEPMIIKVLKKELCSQFLPIDVRHVNEVLEGGAV